MAEKKELEKRDPPKELKARSLERITKDIIYARSKPPERKPEERYESHHVCNINFSNSGFTYLYVHFSSSQVFALFDNGISINLMSEELFSALQSKIRMHV